jgi:hypothetical protein
MTNKFLALGLAVALTGGCASLGGFGKADQATRFLADVACVTAVTAAYGEIAGDPSINGARTVTDVIMAIQKVGSGAMPKAVMDACAESFSYASKDMAGLMAQINAAPTTPEVKPMPTARRAGTPPPAPKTVQPVVVPLR